MTIANSNSFRVTVNPAGGGPTSVLWAADPDAPSPFNFTALGGGAGTNYTLGSFYDADYGGNLIALTHLASGAGQVTIGPVLGQTLMDAVFAALGSGDMYMRWLLKFVGGNFWGSWTDLGYGWEYKWVDFGLNGASRIIPKFRQASYNADGNHGGLNVRVDGSSQVEWHHSQTAASDPFVGDTLLYLEIGLLADGTLRVWLANYDGTGTEYGEGAPYHDSGPGWHTWNPSLIPAGERPINTFINHEVTTDHTIHYHFAINNSFIGPGALSSQN